MVINIDVDESDLVDALDLLEYAWGIIANAGGGDWNTQSKDWKRAAERFRDSYHRMIQSNMENKQ